MLMNKAQIAHFQELLTNEKASLETELAKLGKQIGTDGDWIATPPEQDGNEPEYFDQADHVEEFENRVAALKNLETRYNEVIEALQRIDTGTYGKDINTGKPIDEKRLEANPAAKTNI